jgi:hypothetical protein
MMLKIDETSAKDGTLAPVFLLVTDGALKIVGIANDGAPLVLPPGALAAVMARYGAPFDPDAPITVVDSIALGDGGVLRHVRHLASYDVIARDYLVHDRGDGTEPLCAMATRVAAALAHLARVRAQKPQPA